MKILRQRREPRFGSTRYREIATEINGEGRKKRSLDLESYISVSRNSRSSSKEVEYLIE